MKTVLHYTGYDDDAGGIVSVIRNLAATALFRCMLGVNRGCRQRREPALETLELPEIIGETISVGNFWRARTVAREVQAWLAADTTRIFHGHSRAGLLVALWLHWRGERRFVASVHCYGRQRWFYRWAARQLGSRLFWLSPAMRDYYGAPGADWNQCIPGGVPASAVSPAVRISGKLRLGGAGALVSWKGWPRVVEALAGLVPDDRAHVTFEHIGGGEAACHEALLALVQQHGLADQVKFSGAEPSAERLLGGIDLLVIASDREPFSMAMLEALAAGVPVLAADGGGARDIIREGVNGSRFTAGDENALAREIFRWLHQPPVLARNVIQASTRPVAEIAAAWIEVYKGL